MTTAAPERDFVLEGTADRPDTVSQSLLARLDVCPASGLLYLRHKGGPQGHAQARGSAFHAFHERAIKQMMEMGEITMPGEVARDLQQAIIDERTDLVLRAYDQDVCRQCAWNWAEATILDLDAIVAVEQTLELELGDWTVRGRLDFAEVRDTEAWIKDPKTSLHIPSQADVEESFQLPTYGLLFAFGQIEDRPFALGDGVNTFHLGLSFPRYTTEAGDLVERWFTVTRAELAEHRIAIERLLRILDECLDSGEWPASSGSHCSTCPARPECPIPAQFHELDDVLSAQDAEKTAQGWFQLDAEAKRLKKSLRAWATENGPIRVGDRMLDFKKTETKPAVRDWGELMNGIARTTTNGEPFDLEVHRTPPRFSSKFDLRKVEEDER